ncbi:hypothetical protein GCM10020254_77520 [Streptomyces goshikiensis]
MAAGTLTGPAAPAQAAGRYGAKAVMVAASKQGSPYAYGATGPNRFDCSGLILYAFRKAGRPLPRTANQQYQHTRHIRQADRVPGDLVFFPRGATMTHVGIYAGHDRIWHAPGPAPASGWSGSGASGSDTAAPPDDPSGAIRERVTVAPCPRARSTR